MEDRFVDIMEGIIERENRFINAVTALRTGGGYKTYIYGGGLVGTKVKKQLELHGIMCDGIVVNRQYWNNSKDTICLEQLLEDSEEQINLIVAFRGYQSKSLDIYKDKINAVIDMDCWAGADIAECMDELTYEWMKANVGGFQKLFDMLQDELSRTTLFAYLNQKISADYKYLENVRRPFQYFDEEINKMSQQEVFVDCGAYDGDSAVDFIHALQRRGYDTYDEIVSFEPDPDNYKKLKGRNLKNHICIPKGVGSEKGTISFSAGGTSSRCAESGDICVEVDTIDHVMNGRRVTMIKMDIEGAELDALHGARETIAAYKPLLAICVYHKRDDLLTIPEYIKSIVPGYKLFLRAYERAAIELVLYAVF